ncbi:hypothetical protein G5V58_11460 [Nocardioides anomalus]|uniref:Uncharacterized protein n=1 Tax=Nocardioides anomalus TaxID=2712223 RepID=A0A6G6WDW8_9ACTN|nr:hypothetical protein [Nocardioides anomalus]QIG43295.1 hypothetical protein G5V58_11460 [Nocardioides anomalus]
MPVFRSRVPPFALDRRVLHHLLLEAVRTADPQASVDLHRMARHKLGREPGWAWWTERCRDVEDRGRHDVALLGVEFALDAAGAPWVAPSLAEQDRLEELRARLHDALAAGADAEGAARLRRPDRARCAQWAQGAASTAG